MEEDRLLELMRKFKKMKYPPVEVAKQMHDFYRRVLGKADYNEVLHIFTSDFQWETNKKIRESKDFKPWLRDFYKALDRVARNDKERELIADEMMSRVIISSITERWSQDKQVYKFSQELLDSIGRSKTQFREDLIDHLPAPTFLVDTAPIYFIVSRQGDELLFVNIVGKEISEYSGDLNINSDFIRKSEIHNVPRNSFMYDRLKLVSYLASDTTEIAENKAWALMHDVYKTKKVRNVITEVRMWECGKSEEET